MNATNFRRVALVAWIMQALIVLSGAAVRLTEAGLGCEDWPTCNDEQLVPEWELHGWIEFGNRLVSGLVAVSAVVAVFAAYRRIPRRRDLVVYAWGLVVGTLAQVVLGGITVLLDLNPIVVSGHFLLSMVLLWFAQTLWLRAGPADASRPEAVPERLTGRLVRAQLVLATAVLLTGTVVTGTGPNSGDSRAERLGFDLTAVARVHSVCVWLLLASLVALAVKLARGPAGGSGGSAAVTIVRWMLIAVVIQGAIGYTQFSLGVPAGLVEVHILGALIVWSLAILLDLRVNRTGLPVPSEDRRPADVGAALPAG